MPTYTYMCDGCGETLDHVFRMDSVRPGVIRCAGCKGHTKRIFTPWNVSCFQEYNTKDITGEMIRIGSPRQETEICDRHGVARLLDGEGRIDPKSKAKRQKAAIAKMPDFHDDYEKTRAELGVRL